MRRASCAAPVRLLGHHERARGYKDEIRAGQILLGLGIALYSLHRSTNPKCVISHLAQCSTKCFVPVQTVLVWIHGCASTDPVLFGRFTDMGSSCPTCIHRSKQVSWFIWALSTSWFSAKLNAGREDTRDGKISLISTKETAFLD